jgi:hypothetical protein
MGTMEPEEKSDYRTATPTPETPGEVELMSNEVLVESGSTHYWGTIEEKRWEDFGPFIVDAAGIEILTTGNGDIDLFVAQGRAPTALDYDCASMTLTGEESCTLDGEGTYYVAVFSYQGPVDYELDVQYSPESRGAVTGDALNLSLRASAFTSEGQPDRLIDGDRWAAWFTEEPTFEEPVSMRLEWDEDQWLEGVLIDWVPGLSPTWAHAIVEHRGEIWDLGRFLVDGRRTTLEFEGEASTIEITFENTDEEHFIGIREIWTW